MRGKGIAIANDLAASAHFIGEILYVEGFFTHHYKHLIVQQLFILLLLFTALFPIFRRFHRIAIGLTSAASEEFVEHVHRW